MVSNIIKCISEGCNETPKWGKDWVPIYCDSHKIESEAFMEKKCILCGYIHIVDKDNVCKKCKIPEHMTNPTHPKFSIHVPSLRSTKSEYTLEPKQLRATRSSPSILIQSLAKLPTINLKSNLIKIQSQSELQTIIVAAKEKLKTAKANLAMYSIIDNLASKIARERLFQAEKDVEDACKAWCHGCRK